MGKLYFEDIVDVNTPHPYVFVYMLPDNEAFSPSAFVPFYGSRGAGGPKFGHDDIRVGQPSGA